jgi:peptidoglycan/xylan/chitin deacetylase (PgdA/CDA1 family)
MFRSIADRLRYSAVIDRPKITWPDNARVALWICPNVLFFEYDPEPFKYTDRFYQRGCPDIRFYGHQDFGNRVGFWRTLRLLDDYALKPTAAISAAVLVHFPEIRDAMVERDWDYMIHSMYNTRYLWGISPEQERAYYRDVLDTVLSHTGKVPRGAMSPGPSALTVNTPDLLAEAGFIYNGDLNADDQPFPITVEHGKLISMPYGVINAVVMGQRRRTGLEADDFARIIRDQFDQLYEEGEASGTVMCIPLHSDLTAQPHRIKYIRQALEYILARPNVWQATASDIAQYYLDHYYDAVVSHTSASNAEYATTHI